MAGSTTVPTPTRSFRATASTSANTDCTPRSSSRPASPARSTRCRSRAAALTFALSTDLGRRSTLAIPSLQPALVGGLSGNLSQIGSGGDYSGLDGNTSRALRIVDEALARLTVVEGSVDGFHNAQISSASSVLAALEEDLQETILQTDGYDEEEEMVLLAKNEDLMANAMSGLAILDQQRLSIVNLIKHIAGLD